MDSHAISKGEIKIGAGDVPANVYAAVQDRDVRFHILQHRPKSRVE